MSVEDKYYLVLIGLELSQKNQRYCKQKQASELLLCLSDLKTFLDSILLIVSIHSILHSFLD